jgi:hypothetical protein
MKEFQQEVQDLCDKHGIEASVEHRVLDTVSELGEVAKEVLTATEDGMQGPEYRGNVQRRARRRTVLVDHRCQPVRHLDLGDALG